MSAAVSSPVVITSLTNAASGAGGAIAAGELVTLKGTMPGPAAGISFSGDTVAATLGGTQVWFGAYAAPILYSSATQINAIVPWEVAGQAQVSVEIQSAPGNSAGLNFQVANAAPGIFTNDATGGGQAAALNQDGSRNGPANKAARGSYVSVYFTGAGAINPAGITGSISGLGLQHATESVTATVGGVRAAVTFAGAAPTLVSGANQLNIQIPANTPAGSAVPVVIMVDGRPSAATATLSVH